MKENAKAKRDARLRRAVRVRKKVQGNAECPRLSVFRSNRHVFAQIIDDEAGMTLVSSSSFKKEAPALEDASGKVALAKIVGQELAQKAAEKGISKVVFDRAGFKFHGRIAALAAGARDGGLKF